MRCTLTLLLAASLSPLIAAQNGSNFKVMSNGLDAVYAGLGAGGSQVAGRDGFGVWMTGEEVRGGTITTLGDFGYREVGWRETACVFGPPVPGLRIEFPALITVEHDGVNPWTDGGVFTRPLCPTAACFPLGNSVGFAPYGTPAGSSASFLLAIIPSVLGLPSTSSFLLPNIGLVPSSNGGTATLIGAVASSLPIASTGFCWTVQFGWAPSALPGNDDINGWWRWHTNATSGHQYWGMSTDELNAWQSNTVFTDAGQTALVAFTANLDYVWQSLARDPATNDALSPVGSNGTGVYYATGAGVPDSGSSVNGGFDLGRHTAWAVDGIAGVPNPATGLGNQDPAGSGIPGLIPTLGFVTWSNGPQTTPTLNRQMLIQIDFDLTFGIDPALSTDVLAAFGQVRLPISVPVSFPAFPQALTVAFLPIFDHTTNDQTGISGWPDPDGFPAGSFGVVPRVGSSVHLPVNTGVSFALSVPVGSQWGSIPDEGQPILVPKTPIGTGSPSFGSRTGLLGGP